MTLDERAEALAKEYADECVTSEAKAAILKALQAVVEACAEVCEKVYDEARDRDAAFYECCLTVAQQIRQEVGR